MSEPMDEAYLTKWARERQAAAMKGEIRSERCGTGCPGHRWHGLRCSTEGCGCPSSWGAA